MAKLLPGLIVGLILLASCETRGFIEPAPLEFSTGPVTVNTIETTEVGALCKAWLPNGLKAEEFYAACYVPSINTIYMPTNDNSKWWDELYEHEKAHARGWRHKPRM